MTDATDLVVLVDERDRVIGSIDKLQAHRAGARHRAVSVFVFDRNGRLLLQRRAEGKYHSAGRWANTCCTHPRPGESNTDAAQRRLREEMGMECTLSRAGVFSYRCEVGEGLMENEIDHLFIGRVEEEPKPNPMEVQEYRWTHLNELAREMSERPEDFAPWLGPALKALETARLQKGAATEPRS